MIPDAEKEQLSAEIRMQTRTIETRDTYHIKMLLDKVYDWVDGMM